MTIKKFCEPGNLLKLIREKRKTAVVCFVCVCFFFNILLSSVYQMNYKWIDVLYFNVSLLLSTKHMAVKDNKTVKVNKISSGSICFVNCFFLRLTLTQIYDFLTLCSMWQWTSWKRCEWMFQTLFFCFRWVKCKKISRNSQCPFKLYDASFVHGSRASNIDEKIIVRSTIDGTLYGLYGLNGLYGLSMDLPHGAFLQ